jgi:hypothetical protein
VSYISLSTPPRTSDGGLEYRKQNDSHQKSGGSRNLVIRQQADGRAALPLSRWKFTTSAYQAPSTPKNRRTSEFVEKSFASSVYKINMAIFLLLLHIVKAEYLTTLNMTMVYTDLVVSVEVGTPPKRFNLTLATGVDFIWIASNATTDIDTMDKFYCSESLTCSNSFEY